MNSLQSQYKSLLTSCARCLLLRRNIMVYESSRKAEYEHKIEQPSLKKILKTGIKSLPKEFKMLGKEIKDHFTPQSWMMEHGDYKYLWKLNNESAINQWVVSTDADMEAGRSTAQLSLSRQKCLLFHGYLNTQVPDDGASKYAGYVNMRSPYNMKSFARLRPYDWSDFTHIVIRCRGDGRPYQLNLQIENYFDILWHDLYAFSLYTRGGPYWQIAKIPFSKFFLTSKGRIQDKQEMIESDRIRNFGISLADGAEGRFELEIDYIGLVYDAFHTNTFFYEMYDGDPFLS